MKTAHNDRGNDAALVAAALSGDTETFSPIVARYQDAVFAVALARLHNFNDAEDTAQEVFVEAFQNLGTLSNPSRLGAWLRSITIHRCIDHLRKRREFVDLEEVAQQLEASSVNPHTQIEQQELRDRVMTAIGQLSKTQRETTTLFYINGYSQQEVANIQEVPIGTVRRRLHDARVKLKEEMMNVVEDVLKSEAPKESFGERVYDILSRHGRPAVPWQEWDDIAAKLKDIGAQGMEGFVQALESPHTRTRIFAMRMVEAFIQNEEGFEALVEKSLNDPSKKLRKMAFLMLLDIMVRRPSRRTDLMSHLLRFLTDRSRLIRWTIASYLSHVDDFVEHITPHIPLHCVVRAYLDENDPGVRWCQEELMEVLLTKQITGHSHLTPWEREWVRGQQRES